MAYPFRYFLRVRYAECDAQKIVFNSRYGEYVELAMTELIRALGFAEGMISGKLDYQLVKQTLEWKASAHFDQILEVSVIPKITGTTSFIVLTEFRAAGESQVLTTVETVYVMIDAHTKQKRPLPEDFRQALLQGAINMATDHAGFLNSNFSIS